MDFRRGWLAQAGPAAEGRSRAVVVGVNRGRADRDVQAGVDRQPDAECRIQRAVSAGARDPNEQHAGAKSQAEKYPLHPQSHLSECSAGLRLMPEIYESQCAGMSRACEDLFRIRDSERAQREAFQLVLATGAVSNTKHPVPAARFVRQTKSGIDHL